MARQACVYGRFGVPWVGHGLLMLCVAACGESMRNTAGEGGSSGSPAPSGADSGGSGTVNGGSGTVNGGSGTVNGGSGGAVSAGGQAGGSGGGAKPHLSGATAEEEAILDPLFGGPAQLDGANLDQLVELGARIGLARGYAMCRCILSAEQPPEDVAQLLSRCARDEAGMLAGFSWYSSPGQGTRTNEALARCLRDESVQIPWLDDALRCQLERHQKDGRAWLDLCSIPHEPQDSSAWPVPAIDTCPNVEQLSQVIQECRLAGYCADGTRVSGRCSGLPECADASDERGCFDVMGQDMLQCGDAITHPSWPCVAACGVEMNPPLCDETRLDRFLCADGSDVSNAVVCDRKDDCADQTDELYCLR